MRVFEEDSAFCVVSTVEDSAFCVVSTEEDSVFCVVSILVSVNIKRNILEINHFVID